MKKIIFFVGCFFLMMDSLWALEISCPEVVSPGEKIIVHVDEDNFNGLKAKYNFNSKFMYQDMKVNSS